jgi:hypothetical protein
MKNSKSITIERNIHGCFILKENTVIGIFMSHEKSFSIIPGGCVKLIILTNKVIIKLFQTFTDEEMTFITDTLES